MLNLIKEQDTHDVIDKIYLYARDLSEPKYEYLIKKREDAGIKYLNNLNVFILWKTFVRILMIIIQAEKKNLIIFDDMIADIMKNKKFQAIIKELIIRWRKVIFHLFLSHNLISLLQKMLD